jgi:hypothetical protein
MDLVLWAALELAVYLGAPAAGIAFGCYLFLRARSDGESSSGRLFIQAIGSVILLLSATWAIALISDVAQNSTR